MTKLKMGQNSTILNVTNSKTENVTKLENMKCEKTQKVKMWQNLKNQNVILKNSKCDKT